jgi:glycosyltransferase involved in cell wall biosynthesis
MKISLIIRSLDSGGSQRQLAMLANGLAQRSHDVTVIVLYPGGAIEAALKDTAVRVLSLGKAGRWDVIMPLVRLWRHLRMNQPDVLYTFQPVQSVISALVLPPWQSTKLVFGLRTSLLDFDKYDTLSRLAYRLEDLLARRADLIVANGLTVRAAAVARGWPAERMAVIPNGIDIEIMRPNEIEGLKFRQAWGIGEGDFVVGIVARLDPMKDHATFLLAASQFLERNHDARFVLVGDGPSIYRSELRSMAQSLGLEARTIWAGDQVQVRAAYNAFDVATLTSLGEGFPNVIGEAMACGRPVVATDVGEIGSIINDCGELVPPRRPDLLCEAWMRMRQRLAADKSNLQAGARDHIARHFSVAAMVERSERVFSELCAGRAANLIAAEFS